jgi:hypothetical protein
MKILKEAEVQEASANFYVTICNTIDNDVDEEYLQKYNKKINKNEKFIDLTKEETE